MKVMASSKHWILNTCHSDIKKAVTALTRKKKKGVEDDEMDMDNEANADR